MNAPYLSKDDVEQIVSGIEVVGSGVSGGQKTVFACMFNGKKYAIKFVLLYNTSHDAEEFIKVEAETTFARVKREIDIMQKIDSHNVVKMGPIPLTEVEYKNQRLLYYMEEWIEGEVLQEIVLRQKTLSIKESLLMCRDILKGIEIIWSLNSVHRDIKPQNIIRRSTDGTYVLLDMGVAFDLNDKSLTSYGFVPGTKLYFSPEQLDFNNKRNIDFRSDVFSLGIVLYIALTGKHPFYEQGVTEDVLFQRIRQGIFCPPIIYNINIPTNVNNIVCRMLNSQPHSRYRKCSILLSELDLILNQMEV